MKRMNNKIELGNRWVICDVCDFGYRLSDIKKGITGTQTGKNICPDCFDNKHPLDTWEPRNRRSSYQIGANSLESSVDAGAPDVYFVTQGSRLPFASQTGIIFKLVRD